MNEPSYPPSAPDGAWSGSDHKMRSPDTSAVLATDKAPQAAVDTLNRVAQGAHEAVDRFAEIATPKVRKLGETLSDAELALRARADQLGRTRDEWTESLRGTVRSNPLTAIAAAFALGAVIARVTR